MMLSIVIEEKKTIMKRPYFIILTLFISTIMLSCNEEEMNTIEWEGTYEGTFTVEYLASGDTFTNPVTVNFSGNRYSSSTGDNRFPAGGNGTFVLDNNSVTFNDENFWTADFDWNLILNGNYTITESETSITLSATKNNVGIYTYELIK